LNAQDNALLVRDGADAAQWSDRGPFLEEAALRADLASGPVLTSNTRLKVSNHGCGLGTIEAWRRLKRIDVQVARPQGPSRLTLAPPARSIKLAR